MKSLARAHAPRLLAAAAVLASAACGTVVGGDDGSGGGGGSGGSGGGGGAGGHAIGQVFALHWDEVAMVEQIGTVDVATAVFSPIADIPGVTMMSGQALLDPVARTYSFVRSPAAGEPQESSYVTVDIDTGELIANAPIVAWFNDPQYDPETGQVFALRWDSAAMVEQLVTVEVTTAAFSPVVDIPGVTAVSGEVVLDPVGRTYSFVRSAGPGEPQESSYVTVNIDSGAVVSVAPIVDWFNYPRAVR